MIWFVKQLFWWGVKMITSLVSLLLGPARPKREPLHTYDLFGPVRTAKVRYLN